ncbi:MAG: hypothetical protein R2773_01505 [Flavobacteriaceae bacterium]
MLRISISTELKITVEKNDIIENAISTFAMGALKRKSFIFIYSRSTLVKTQSRVAN